MLTSAAVIRRCSERADRLPHCQHKLWVNSIVIVNNVLVMYLVLPTCEFALSHCRMKGRSGEEALRALVFESLDPSQNDSANDYAATMPGILESFAAVRCEVQAFSIKSIWLLAQGKFGAQPIFQYRVQLALSCAVHQIHCGGHLRQVISRPETLQPRMNAARRHVRVIEPEVLCHSCFIDFEPLKQGFVLNSLNLLQLNSAVSVVLATMAVAQLQAISQVSLLEHRLSHPVIVPIVLVVVH
mmetsp:Transcript_38233/g.89761  ORF Transcript_38233/g.89761 Transcript_38233/m.89761 type:complete len:242 (+) Transcript_38233:133-858(+)